MMDDSPQPPTCEREEEEEARSTSVTANTLDRLWRQSKALRERTKKRTWGANVTPLKAFGQWFMCNGCSFFVNQLGEEPKFTERWFEEIAAWLEVVGTVEPGAGNNSSAEAFLAVTSLLVITQLGQGKDANLRMILLEWIKTITSRDGTTRVSRLRSCVRDILEDSLDLGILTPKKRWEEISASKSITQAVARGYEKALSEARTIKHSNRQQPESKEKGRLDEEEAEDEDTDTEIAGIPKNLAPPLNYRTEYTELCEMLMHDKASHFSERERAFYHTLVTLLGAIGCRPSDFIGTKFSSLTKIVIDRSDSTDTSVFMPIELFYSKGRKWAQRVGTRRAVVFPDLQNRARCPVMAMSVALTMIDERIEITEQNDLLSLLFASFKGKEVTLYEEERTKRLEGAWHKLLCLVPHWDKLAKARTSLYSLRKTFAVEMNSRTLFGDAEIRLLARLEHASVERMSREGDSRGHYYFLNDEGHRIAGLVAANRHRGGFLGDPMVEFLVHNLKPKLLEIAEAIFPRNVIRAMQGPENLLPHAAYVCLAGRHSYVQDNYPSLFHLPAQPFPEFRLDFTRSLMSGKVVPLRYVYEKREIVQLTRQFQEITVYPPATWSSDEEEEEELGGGLEEEEEDHSDRHSVETPKGNKWTVWSEEEEEEEEEEELRLTIEKKKKKKKKNQWKEEEEPRHRSNSYAEVFEKAPDKENSLQTPRSVRHRQKQQQQRRRLSSSARRNRVSRSPSQVAPAPLQAQRTCWSDLFGLPSSCNGEEEAKIIKKLLRLAQFSRSGPFHLKLTEAQRHWTERLVEGVPPMCEWQTHDSSVITETRIAKNKTRSSSNSAKGKGGYYSAFTSQHKTLMQTHDRRSKTYKVLNAFQGDAKKATQWLRARGIHTVTDLGTGALPEGLPDPPTSTTTSEQQEEATAVARATGVKVEFI